MAELNFYEALIARIRYHIQKANFMGLKEHEGTLLLKEAADAIEGLLAYCDNQEDTIKELVEELEKKDAAPTIIEAEDTRTPTDDKLLSESRG